MQDLLALELIKVLKTIQVKDGIDGQNGKDGFCFPLNNMFSFVADLEGNIYFYINEEGETSKKLLGNFKGLDGQNGINGTNGLSAYEIAQKNGFEGTEIEWLESLKVGSSNSINPNLLPVALCKFDSTGGTIKIRSSYGIKNIIRLSEGNYQAYFEKEMKDTNYIVMIGNAIVHNSWFGSGNDVYIYNKDSFIFEHVIKDNGADTEAISFVVYEL